MNEDLYPNIYFYRRLVQAKVFIETHFDEAINLDAIADEAYYSKFHFLRAFKKIYQQTPHQFLTHVRLEKAKIMLHSAISIADTCYACGFESTSSFTTLFKKNIGCTPAEYRLQRLNLTADRQALPLKYIPGCFAEKCGWTDNSNF